MNMKSVIILLCYTFAILSGVLKSFAQPQYLDAFNKVYGNGSCSTCHVINSGQRDFNGTFGQHNFSNGTFQRRDSNRTFDMQRANGTFRQRSSNRTFPLNSYGTLFGSQPGHSADPEAALMAIGQPHTETPPPATTPEMGVQAAPGFEVMVSLVGLFAFAVLARRHNK